MKHEQFYKIETLYVYNNVIKVNIQKMVLHLKALQMCHIIVSIILIVICIKRSKCDQLKSTQNVTQYPHSPSTTECHQCNKTSSMQYLNYKNNSDNATTERLNKHNNTNISKEKQYGFDINNITSPCYLCKGPDVINTIQALNISHLFEGINN